MLLNSKGVWREKRENQENDYHLFEAFLDPHHLPMTFKQIGNLTGRGTAKLRYAKRKKRDTAAPVEHTRTIEDMVEPTLVLRL